MFLECDLLFRLGVFLTSEKEYVAAENKQRNISLLWTDTLMTCITPAVGGNCMLMRIWIK